MTHTEKDMNTDVQKAIDEIKEEMNEWAEKRKFTAVPEGQSPIVNTCAEFLKRLAQRGIIG